MKRTLNIFVPIWVAASSIFVALRASAAFQNWVWTVSGLSGLLAASWFFYRGVRVPLGQAKPAAAVGVGLVMGVVYAAICFGIASGSGLIAVWIFRR